MVFNYEHEAELSTGDLQTEDQIIYDNVNETYDNHDICLMAQMSDCFAYCM